jgi:hypothetical protein
VIVAMTAPKMSEGFNMEKQTEQLLVVLFLGAVALPCAHRSSGHGDLELKRSPWRMESGRAVISMDVLGG